ncbi:MAG: FACT complex subunit [Chrysothrix sp. TS-e1954]|nr:MAG: FACT complex subunit [Chrysothrix sp. TS-e1954]
MALPSPLLYSLGGPIHDSVASPEETFENIHLDLLKVPGRCRFAESGFAWKPSNGGETFTLDKDNISQAQWSKAARGHELKVLSRSSGLTQLDGFEPDVGLNALVVSWNIANQTQAFDRLAKAFKLWYGVHLEHREHALRGWNWGKAEFGKSEVSFNVQNRPAFELPYTEIINTNLAGRNEVAVDLQMAGSEANDAMTNGHKEAAKKKGRKFGRARDQLVEARFYIPGTVLKKEKKEEPEDGEDGEVSAEDEEGEEQNAANTWYETLVDKAEIGDVAGDTLASFIDILHLTPRGRFDIDLYEKSFRLRGKTYDYKIPYENIKKFLVLPKPDDVHTLITIGLDPPLRQGQTRYPFVVMQTKRDDDIELELNVSEEDLESKYKDILQRNYSAPTFIVLTNLFKALCGRKVISPSKEFSSRHHQSGIKCSIKANEGHFYCMDKSFMFVPKPATYIAHDQIAHVTFSRVGGAVSASRTFDITFTMKAGTGEQQFSNVNREEQEGLENFMRDKSIKVRNEMAEDGTGMLAQALKEEALGSSDDEVVDAARGSADDDSEEEDEDFKADSESDVAEEYNEDVADSGSDSDANMSDAASEEEKDTAEVVERPKKKPKTSK